MKTILENYKDLGFQNGWDIERYDKDWNPCSESGEPAAHLGFSKEQNPEYRNCIKLKHNTTDTSFNSEHTVICEACKIYWKYDSSD